MKIFLLIFFFSSQLKAECMGFNPFGEISEQFINPNLKIIKELQPKVMEVEVSLDGSGQINLVVDEEGKLHAITILYKDEIAGLLTIQDLRAGKNISFKPKNKEDPSPLILQLKPQTSIDQNDSAVFLLKVLTSLDPMIYKDTEISLKKIGQSWVPSVKNQKVSKITLSPKLGWSGWTGTFKSFEFK